MAEFGSELPESLRKFLKTDIRRLFEFGQRDRLLKEYITNYVLNRAIPMIPIINNRYDKIEYENRDFILEALELINNAGYDLHLEIVCGSKIYRRAFLISVDNDVESIDSRVIITIKDEEDPGFPVLSLDSIDKLIVHIPKEVRE